MTWSIPSTHRKGLKCIHFTVTPVTQACTPHRKQRGQWKTCWPQMRRRGEKEKIYPLRKIVAKTCQNTERKSTSVVLIYLRMQHAGKLCRYKGRIQTRRLDNISKHPCNHHRHTSNSPRNTTEECISDFKASEFQKTLRHFSFRTWLFGSHLIILWCTS